MCGRAGSELDRLYLPKAGLQRSGIYCSNAFKCLNTKKQAPKHNLVSTCAEHWLPWEMRRVQPTYLIVGGSTALKLFPGRRLELHHGRPFRGSLYRTFHGQREAYWSGIVIPTYNPAAGLRSGDYMTYSMDDFQQIGKMVRRYDDWVTKNIPIDPYPNPTYVRLHGVDQVARYVSSIDWVYPVWGRPGMGLDTETIPSPIPGAPDPGFCLSFSLQPGTGAVIMATDIEALAGLFTWMDVFRPVVYIHNGLFDLPVIDQMGLPKHLLMGSRSWVDTMIRAYHQKDLPKALKVLSYRYLGAEMRTFDEVVLPHSIAKLSTWLQAVAGYEVQIITHGKKGKLLKSPKILTGWDKYRLPRQTGLRNKAQTLDDNLQEWMAATEDAAWDAFEASLDEDGDDVASESEELASPWERIKAWPANMLGPAIEIFGPPPVKSIEHVPDDEMDRYACRDSDVGLRLGIGLLRQREVMRLYA